MKKTSTRLQLTRKTIRVLQDGALAHVRGGAGGRREPGEPTDHPTACVVATYSCRLDGGDGL